MKPGRQANRIEIVLQRVYEFWITPLQQFFIQSFRLASSKRGLMILPILIGLLLISLRQMPLAGRDLMPAMDTGIIKIEFETWPNSTVEQTERVMTSGSAPTIYSTGTGFCADGCNRWC